MGFKRMTDLESVTPGSSADASVYGEYEGKVVKLPYSNTDGTLSLSGEAADAKATGDAIREMDEALDATNDNVTKLSDTLDTTNENVTKLDTDLSEQSKSLTQLSSLVGYVKFSVNADDLGLDATIYEEEEE